MSRLLALIAPLPLLLGTQAFAQPMDHSKMSMPAPARPPSAPKPAKVRAKAPPRPAAMPAVAKPAKDAEPSMEMTWPESLPGNSDAAAPGTETAPAMDPQMDHSAMPGMDVAAGEEEVGDEPPPPAPTDHAADRIFAPADMARARAVLRREHGGGSYYKVMANLAEYQIRNREDGIRWEGEAWFGGDIDRFVLKTEGEAGLHSGVESGEVQALFSRAIGPYFDLQAGLRQDVQRGPERSYATIGVEGLAPYWFELQGALFLSTKGEVLGRVEGTYDLRITQRLILQPRIEANFSAQNMADVGVGSGLSNFEAGLRLRYEVRREFAPYVGLSLDRKFGNTADFSRLRGEDPSKAAIVFGIRAWF